MILKIKKPRIGDQRKVKRFAFLPIRISNDEVLWLQTYYRHQVYKRITYHNFDGDWCEKLGWRNHGDVIQIKDREVIVE